MPFTSDALFHALSELGHDASPTNSSSQRYWVAFSGGLDSLVLLHALAALRERIGSAQLCAVHVNHGLNVQANEWAAQCAQQCAELNIPFTLCKVNAAATAGESPEAAARAARYQALSELIEPADILLTAHHQDDQAETLLLQLLRGAGPKGLAAMPAVSAFFTGQHARPLLAFRREDLQAYAEQNHLSWLEDDSNADIGFDRNFLRHRILPELKARFPAMASTLSRSARRCAEASALLEMQAETDLLAMQLCAESVSASQLQALGEVRARNVLHHWIHQRALPLPSEAHLFRLWQDVLGASADAMPLLQWPGVQVRRYRDALFVMRTLAEVDPALACDWDLAAPLPLVGVGHLLAKSVMGEGVDVTRLQNQSVTVRWRRGGEKMCIAGRAGHHALKKLFQETGVPPWQRERIPLIFLVDELVAVTGYWVSQEFAVPAGQAGVVFSVEAAR